jgi:predicted phosphodiesterase
MKKIAIFSDIHGNLEALHSVLADIQSKNFDEIIYLGDAISIGPQSKECLDLLKNSNVRFLLGNHELYYLHGVEIDDEITSVGEKAHYKWIRSLLNKSDEEYLKSCSLYYKYDIDCGKLSDKKILFAHFLISDEKASYPFEDIRLRYDINQWIKQNNEYEYIFIGHEHEPYNEDDVQGVNGDFERETGVLSNIRLVGSAGCTKDDKTTYTSLEIGDTISVTRIYLSYDRNAFLEKLSLIDYPDKEKIAKFVFGITPENLQNKKYK